VRLRWPQLRRVTWQRLALTALNVAGVLICIAQLWAGSEAQHILAAAPLPIAPPAPLREPTQRAADLAAIRDAAVFHESRRFFLAPAVLPAQSRPDYRLSGVMVMPGGTRLALLIQNPSGARLKVREGDALEDWTVASIHAQTVVLSHGEQQLEVRAAPRAGAQ
jgi:hypothetical protein